MNKEDQEKLKDSILIAISKNSYLKKEDFIRILESLNFTEIKDIRISCITGYQIKINDKGNKYVQTLGYDINID